MKLTFLFSHSPDPRINKRISTLKLHYDTSIIYWNRNKNLKLNNVHNDIENIEISEHSESTNPINRIIPTIKFAIRAIRTINKIKPDILYVGNIDMLMIAYLATIGRKNKVKFIYEIADLHRLVIDEPRNSIEVVIKKLTVYLEYILCKKIDLLVITSEKFYDMYFNKLISKEKVIVVPNTPNKDVFNSYTHKNSGKFTVGFIGVVRYKEQMKMLLNAADKCNINVLFAGSEMNEEIKSICKDKNNVEYYGKYDYDKEIAKLYGKVDCIYSVYDADLNNVRIALPNKLYESILCETPIIVSKNTYLSDLVESMGVGVSISHNSIDDLVSCLKNISTNRDFYNNMVKNCSKNKDFIDTEYYNEKLKEKIRVICG